MTGCPYSNVDKLMFIHLHTLVWHVFIVFEHNRAHHEDIGIFKEGKRGGGVVRRYA